jgi:ABC-type Fe3+-siderophore transport system permease subunit
LHPAPAAAAAAAGSGSVLCVVLHLPLTSAQALAWCSSAALLMAMLCLSLMHLRPTRCLLATGDLLVCRVVLCLMVVWHQQVLRMVLATEPECKKVVRYIK